MLSLPQVQGSTTKIGIVAYQADSDLTFVADTGDVKVAINEVMVYDANGKWLATASDDSTHGSLVFDFNGNNGLTIDGLQQGYQVAVLSDDGYNRLEVSNVDPDQGGIALC